VEVAKTFRVGSKGVPVLDKVQSVVAGLILKTEQLRAGRPTLSKAIAFHNAYVSYITLRVMWETGIRAVIDPIEFFLLDLDVGLLGVADKDYEEEAAPRLVPLTPQAQEQLLLYSQHRIKLIAYLASAGIDLTPTTWLFFIEEKKKCCDVRPASLTRQLGGDYPFRMNAQRHFVRTRLIELDAQPASVDALLGHGGLGEEPYGPYSCFSFFDLKRTLCPKIVKLSEMVGWKVIKSVALGETS
jgi:hypothetical protein